MPHAARSALGLLAFVLVLAAPTIDAHAAPAAAEWQVRLLHDCSDDYFGGDAAGGGSHDVIALDVHEAYDAERGDLVVFRLTLDGGSPNGGAPILDNLTFADGSARLVQIRTVDNLGFTSEHAAVDGPLPVLTASGEPDGSRFAVEVTLEAAALDWRPGTRLESFRLISSRGGTEGDFMPGTYNNTLGVTVPASLGCREGQARNHGDYTLRGPGYHVGLEAASVSGTLGQALFADLSVRNPFQASQAVALAVEAPAGIDAVLADADGQPVSELNLMGKENRGLVLTLRAAAAQTGTVRVIATTEHGGHSVLDVPFLFAPAAQKVVEEPPQSSDKDSPTGGVALAAFLVAGTAWLARRGV